MATQHSMPHPTSRSPSPVPAPPTATAPGPRASALQKLYAEAIAHTVKTCSYSNFASCFPTPSSHAPDAMKDLHADFIDKLHHSCKDNFDVILRERDVIASLNDLDRLVDEARRRRAKAQEQSQPGQALQHPVAPHTLPPSSLYLAHLAPSLTEQKTSLDTRLRAAHSENAALLDSVMRQREEIRHLISGFEAAVADLDAANAALPSDQILALTEDAVLLDGHLRSKR